MKYKIYKITNTVNNKLYIGFTSTSLIKRLNKHNYDATQNSYQSKLHRALLKYGKDKFTIRLIKSFKNKNKAFKYEQFLIKKFNTVKRGYNITLGGEGSPGIKISEKQKKAIAKALGRPVIRNDGKVFKSVSEAARKCNLYVANIVRCIQGKRVSTGGYTWKYLTNDPSLLRIKNRKLAILNADSKRFKKRKIRCLTNNKIYPSLMAAAKDLGLDYRNIQAVCAGKRQFHGNMRFKYAD